MPEHAAPSLDVVESWKEIAGYLGRDVRTAIRWEQSRGLPVRRLPGGPKAAVYALRSELDAWRQSRGIHVLHEGEPVAGAPPAAIAPSIAVLPFASLSAEKENEYFSDGLADEIISTLTRIHGLRVTARTSSFAFRGKELDVRDIGARLGVGTLLEGSVQRAGGRIRVSAQLVSCADGCHLWCDRYDRDLTDIFAVQEQIAASIAAALELTTETHPAPRRKTENLEAYNLWLKGRHYRLGGRSVEDVMRAGSCFSQAVALDPDFRRRPPGHRTAPGEPCDPGLCPAAPGGGTGPRGNRKSARPGRTPGRSPRRAGVATRAFRFRLGRRRARV